jgi:hypothetical protein
MIYDNTSYEVATPNGVWPALVAWAAGDQVHVAKYIVCRVSLANIPEGDGVRPPRLTHRPIVTIALSYGLNWKSRAT